MSYKIKVLRILHRPSISGPTFHAAYLTKGLSDKYETKLICGQILEDEVDGTYIFENNNIQHQTIANMKRSINPFQDVLAFIEIRKIIKQYKPDIVHTHAAKSGTLGRLAAWTTGVKTIVHTFHGNVFSGYFNRIITNVFISIERFLARKSSAIIAISEIQRKELVNKYKIASEDKTVVIPLGLELDRFSIKPTTSVWQKPLDKTVFGIVGRITAIKNHHLFVDLIKSLKKDNPVCGLIIGEGDMQAEMFDYAKSQGLVVSNLAEDNSSNSDIIFTGSIKDVNSIIHQIDILTLTSNNEGTPVTLLEGQAASKPILSTEVGGIRDIVSKNSALLTPSGELTPLLENAQKMITDLPHYKSEAEKNSAKIIEKFSAKNLCQNIDSLYSSLTKKH